MRPLRRTLLSAGLISALAAAAPAADLSRQILAHAVPGLAGADDVHQTKIRFLPENTDAWYARWHLLSNAQQSIDITYFNFLKDPFGMAVLGIVREKAIQGVKVRLMVDGRGSLSFASRFLAQAYLRELTSFPNVQVRVFKPLGSDFEGVPRELRNLIASNHDKIILVDGDKAIIGGRNLGTHYFTDPDDDEDAYRDNDVLMAGAGMGAEVQEAFEIEFENLDNYDVHLYQNGDRAGTAMHVELSYKAMDSWVRGRGLIDPEGLPWRQRRLLKKLNKKLVEYPSMTGYEGFAADPWADSATYGARVLDKQSFGDPKNDITANLLAKINGAQESILIQNAYLVLTQEIYDAFKAASDRGVDITILTNSPASTNNVLTQAFFIRDWMQWMHQIPRLRILMTTDHKIHAKTFVFDGDAALIGSYNLDPMSQTINSEVAVLVEDPGFAGLVRARLEEDMPAMVECEIRVDRDGTLHRVHGPEDYLKGIAGKIIRIIAKLDFLRPLV